MADRVLPTTTSETSSSRGKAENVVNTVPAQGPWPNTYEASLCQETNSPSERFLVFFRFPGTWRSRSSVACPDLISEHWCTPLWLHQTLIEALSPVRAMAEKRP